MTEEKIKAEDAMNRARDLWLAADLVSFGVCTELKQLEDPDSCMFPEISQYMPSAYSTTMISPLAEISRQSPSVARQFDPF